MDKELKKHQADNELIAVFCGGVLESIPLIGEVYRFNNTSDWNDCFKEKYLSVDTIPRKNLLYHWDYNWLMVAALECYEKKHLFPELEEKYKEISEELTDGTFWIKMPYLAVVEFIKLYNELNK